MPNEEIMDLDAAISATLAESGGADHASEEVEEETTEDEPTVDEVDDTDEAEDESEGDEPTAGEMRQADYTRKTQELAQERRAIAAEREELSHARAVWDALQEDPRKAILALNDVFADALMGEEPDPRDDRISRLEALEQEREDEALLNSLYSDCNKLAQEFEDPFDADELIQFAVDEEIPNLRAAYLLRKDQEAHAAREAKRLKAKRTAPQVEGGSKRAAGTSKPPPDEIDSFEDAFNVALLEAERG